MLIKLQNLTKTYRTEDIETTALAGINVEVAVGDFVAVMGPSGCGKSTFLNVVGMLDTPTAGDYIFQNQNISQFRERQLAVIRKRNIGFVFQNFNLIDELTVRENVELALLYHQVPGKDRRQRAAAVMDKMGIAHRASHRPSQLSGGQQQRVAVARALVGKPALVLADEPTGNLDSRHGREVMQMLQQLNDEGTTIIMVTHSREHADWAKRTINLFDGKIVAQNQRAA